MDMGGFAQLCTAKMGTREYHRSAKGKIAGPIGPKTPSHAT